MTFDPGLLRSHVWLYPRIIVSRSHENTSKYVDTVTFFQKLEQMSMTPDDLWPMSVEVTCVTLSKGHCVEVPWEYINVCGYSDQFRNIRFDPYLQKLEPKVVDP